MGNNKVNKIRVGLFLLIALFMNVAQAATEPQPIDQLSLHPAILLLDDEGSNVITSGKPYSSKESCSGSGCHDYESITHAFHIEQGRDEARDDFGAKRGFSALVGPGYYGGYNCMGGNNPERLAKKNNASAEEFGDLGSAGWVQRCSSCHSGGGWMEKDRNGRRYDTVTPEMITPFDGDYYNRGTDENNQPASKDTVARWDWKKSGVVENDCLICHVDLKALAAFDAQPILTSHGSEVVDPKPLDLFKYVRTTEFIKGGFFNYANTALLSYVNLNYLSNPDLENQSVVSFVRNDVDGTLIKNGEGLPQLVWNETAAFDADKKVRIPMLRFPDNDNCMMCHRTSNSRRGFYGFGDVAEAIDENNELVDSYETDVHKSTPWIEVNSDNNEERRIENCNACHARNYYSSSINKSVAMNANHNFLKGNSDMDVRNDLDYAPGAKSCEYCHDVAPAKNKDIYIDILTARDGMLASHNTAWESEFINNALDPEARKRITQVHLDQVSCQACHITGKMYRDKPLGIMYRYREGEDGKRKITPYRFKARYFWKDKNSGRVLNKTERDAVFKLVGATDDHENPPQGFIIDPVTGAELAEVDVYMSHGSWRFRDPGTYVDFITLKNAYDKLMVSRGIEKPDMALVWSEPNAYLLSHNTRPAGDALQCIDCHNKRPSRPGYSSQISDEGVLGKFNSKTVTKLLDPRLVREGLVVLDLPYMKMDADGLVTENVADILYATRLDPSMTILKSGSAPVAVGELACAAITDVLKQAGVSTTDGDKLAERLNNSYSDGVEACAGLEDGTLVAFQFQPSHGDESVRRVSLMSTVNEQTKWLASSRAEIEITGNTISKAANYAGMGGLVSDVFSLEITDKNRVEITSFSSPMLVKLPYKGGNANPEQVKLITSSDGSNWTAVNAENIVALQAQSEEAQGYIAFETTHFSYYALVDSTVSVDDSNTESNSEVSGSGGGGCTVRHNAPFDPLFPVIIAMSMFYLWRRKAVKS